MTEFDFDFDYTADLPITPVSGLYLSCSPGLNVIGAANIFNVLNGADLVRITPANISGCIAYWNFEGTVGSVIKDQVNEFNGSMVSGAVISGGRHGYCGSFRGISGTTNIQYVSIPYNPTFNISGPISISAWIKLIALDQWDRIVSHSPLTETWPYTTYGLEMQGDNDSAPGTGQTGQVRFVLASAGSQHSVHTINKPLGSGWVHIVGAYGGGSDMKIYYNGSSQGGSIYQLPANQFVNGLQNGYIDQINTDISIARSSYNNNFFGGMIDEVAIYNRALTQQEVTNLYYAGSLKSKGLYAETPKNLLGQLNTITIRG